MFIHPSKGIRSRAVKITLAVTLLLAACGSSEDAVTPAPAPTDDAVPAPQESPGEPVEFVLATSVGAPSLDPFLEISDARMRRSPLMYDTLVEWTDDFGVAPGLARAWEFDGNILRLFLREDVRFHNGKAMTSADVVYSLGKVLESPGAGFYSQIEAVRAVDDYTVEADVAVVSDALIAALGGRYAYIVPEGAVEEYDLAVTAMGSGPFVVEEFRQGEFLRLTKNENYWRADEVGLDVLTIVVAPDEASIVAGLRSGQIDAAFFEDARIADLLDGQSGLTTFEAPAARWDILDFPALDVEPWSNVKFRQAIAAAIDPEAVMELAANGRGTVLGGHPPALWASLPYADAPYAAQDLSLAQSLLAESGVDTSQPLTLVSIQGYEALNSSAQVIADQLAQIGLKVDIEIQELGTWIDSFVGRTFQTFTMNAWGGWIDPDQLYFNHMHSQPTGRDFRRWDNKEVSDLLDRARSTDNRVLRENLYLEIQMVLAEQVPWMPLYSANFVGAYQDDVSNWSVHPSGFYHGLRWLQVG